MKKLKSKLKLILVSFSIIGIVTFFVVSAGNAAGTVVSSESGDGTYHSSAGYNSEPNNTTTEWQSLGYDTNFNPGESKENYGVTWSINGGSFANEDLYVGDTVQFKFDMYSANVGNGHLANIFKSWVDFGYDGASPDFDDVLAVGSNLVRTGSSSGIDTTYVNSNTVTGYQQQTSFFSGVYDLESEDTIFLRARVTCTESIDDTNGKVKDGIYFENQWSTSYWSNYHWYNLSVDRKLLAYQNAFDAYSDYYQGEIEDWAINVSSRDVSPTPEPATFALFGMGLIGLARLGRKKA